MNRSLSVILVCLSGITGLLIVACGSTPPPPTPTEQDSNIGQKQLPLAIADDDTIWSTNLIPVCWENPSSGDTQERDWVRFAVEGSWEKESAIDFVWWETCSRDSEGIRIRVEDERPHVEALGAKLNGKKNGMVMNFTFNNWDSANRFNRRCSSSDNDRKECIEVIAVHEFGHALGFAHEQNRGDAPYNCQVRKDGPDAVLYITPYDLNSVMNYCNPNWNGNGKLSQSDITGVREIYGPPSGTTVTTTWSGALIALYSRNFPQDFNQDLLCTISIEKDYISANLTRDSRCKNDETRSLVLHSIPQDRVIRLYDNSEGKRNDDWVEIIVKQNVFQKVIGTFEKSFEDNDVRVIYHRDDNLDGKVSLVEIDLNPIGPVIDFYEGNNATENLVCSELIESRDLTLDFTRDHSGCDNDEIRSLVLHNIPRGRIVRLYDNSRGELDDDWVEITVKQNVVQKVIGTFEKSFEDNDVRAVYYENDNLDGKVSRLEIRDHPYASERFVSFYKGIDLREDNVCDLSLEREAKVNFKEHNRCENDDARFLVLNNVKSGTIIQVYDDSSCTDKDDWAEIIVKKNLSRHTIGSFEQSYSDDKVSVTYDKTLEAGRKKGNLDGKVSCVRIIPGP